MELNRRDFLKGALATGIVATGAGLAGCAPAASDAKVEEAASSFPEGLQASDFEESPVIVEPITDIAEEKTFDVVVVGAGTGGVPAALSALEEGATVAVLQKESKPIAQGGTCSGVLLDQSDEQGVMNYLQGYLEDCRWRADRKLAETYCKYSGEAIRWTQVRTAEAGFPPYTVRPTAVTEYEDGSKCARRSIMFGPKPYNNGTMVEHLAELAASKGVEFFYSTPGVQLVTDESGTVTGVIGKSGSSYIKFNATKGVILSTGDYQNNQSLVERYCPDVKEFDRKQSNKTGDGILMSMAVGAGFVPVGHSHMMHDFDSGPMFDEPFLFVNEDGERFMNEDCVFEEVNCVLRNQPKPGWYSQIFDDDYVEQVTEWGGKPTDKEKIQVYMPDVKMDRSAESGANVIESLIGTYCCDTLDELAAKLEIPADALKKSVARYNEMVDAGFDADFGKQAKYLKKIEKAPFWGIHKHVRVSALCAGVTVNENYQALRTDGEVIPNLWVTGFSAGQLCGSPDWSMYQGGMSAGHCIMTGRICGIQAATCGKLESKSPVTEADVEALA